MYGAGVIAIACVSLAWSDFDPGQPMRLDFPYRTVFAYAAAAFMLVSAATVEWRQTAPWGSAALAGYFAIVVVILMNGRVVLARPHFFGVYSGAAEQLAIAAGALIVYAATASIDNTLAKRLSRVGQLVFGICAVLFGAAHFVYMNLTTPLVPKWLSPSAEFWARATGLGHIAAGVAIVLGVQSRLAAIVLTCMFASFTALVHLPMLLADPDSHFNWSENALNLALTGVAWVVAESLGRRKASSSVDDPAEAVRA